MSRQPQLPFTPGRLLPKAGLNLDKKFTTIVQLCETMLCILQVRNLYLGYKFLLPQGFLLGTELGGTKAWPYQRSGDVHLCANTQYCTPVLLRSSGFCNTWQYDCTTSSIPWMWCHPMILLITQYHVSIVLHSTCGSKSVTCHTQLEESK